MKIGDRVKDRISGLQGIAVGRTEYLNGCRQFLVSPEKVKDDGDQLKQVWIDEQTLEVVDAGVFADPFEAAVAERVPATAGGPSSSTRRGE